MIYLPKVVLLFILVILGQVFPISNSADHYLFFWGLKSKYSSEKSGFRKKIICGSMQRPNNLGWQRCSMNPFRELAAGGF